MRVVAFNKKKALVAALSWHCLMYVTKVSVWVPWIRAMASRRRQQLPQCPRPDPPTPTGCTEDTDCNYEDGEQCNKHNGQCYKRKYQIIIIIFVLFIIQILFCSLQ